MVDVATCSFFVVTGRAPTIRLHDAVAADVVGVAQLDGGWHIRHVYGGGKNPASRDKDVTSLQWSRGEKQGVYCCCRRWRSEEEEGERHFGGTWLGGHG